MLLFCLCDMLLITRYCCRCCSILLFVPLRCPSNHTLTLSLLFYTILYHCVVCALPLRNKRPPSFTEMIDRSIGRPQVEAVLSPTAGWLLDIVAFAQPPETLQHRATLEVMQRCRLPPWLDGCPSVLRGAKTPRTEPHCC